MELNICRFQEWLPGSSDRLATCDQRRVGHSGQQCIIIPVCCPEASHASIIVVPTKGSLEAALPEAASKLDLVRKKPGNVQVFLTANLEMSRFLRQQTSKIRGFLAAEKLRKALVRGESRRARWFT